MRDMACEFICAERIPSNQSNQPSTPHSANFESTIHSVNSTPL